MDRQTAQHPESPGPAAPRVVRDTSHLNEEDSVGCVPQIGGAWMSLCHYTPGSAGHRAQLPLWRAGLGLFAFLSARCGALAQTQVWFSQEGCRP